MMKKISKIMIMHDETIEEYKKAMYNCPLFGGYLHMAFVICNNTQIKTFGYNHFRGTGQTVHAEISLMKKLKKTDKNLKINLLVLRINNNGTYGMSKPCENCIHMMEIIAFEKGYVLDKIYFSNYEGEIDGMKFFDLKNEEGKHISRYFRNRELRNHFKKIA